jgi:WD40 repeat protein
LTLLLACGGRQPKSTNEEALQLERVLSRGTLAYAVAFHREAVVSVELAVDFELVVRDPGGRERVRARLGPHEWDVAALAVHGETAFVASADGTVRGLALASGRETMRWHLGDAATAVAVSADGRYLAAGGASGIVCLRRLPGGELLQCLTAHRGRISGLDFDPAGRRLASASWDGGAAVWTVPALAAVAALDTGGAANQIAFAPAGDRLAIATSAAPPDPRRAHRDPRALILLWRPVRGPARPRVLVGHTGAVASIAWSGDGSRLVSGSWDRTVRLWDTRREREVARVARFAHVLRGVAISLDGRRVAAAAWAPTPDAPATALLALRHPP